MFLFSKAHDYLLKRFPSFRSMHLNLLTFDIENELIIFYDRIKSLPTPAHSSPPVTYTLRTKYNLIAGNVFEPDTDKAISQAIKACESSLMFRRIQEEFTQRSPSVKIDISAMRDKSARYAVLTLDFKLA